MLDLSTTTQRVAVSLPFLVVSVALGCASGALVAWCRLSLPPIFVLVGPVCLLIAAAVATMSILIFRPDTNVGTCFIASLGYILLAFGCGLVTHATLETGPSFLIDLGPGVMVSLLFPLLLIFRFQKYLHITLSVAAAVCFVWIVVFNAMHRPLAATAKNWISSLFFVFAMTIVVRLAIWLRAAEPSDAADSR